MRIIPGVHATLHHFRPHRLPWLLAGNGYLLCAALIAVAVHDTLPPGLLLAGLLLLLLNGLLGWLAITYINRLRRQQLALLLEERATNRRLTEEIKERQALEARLRQMACTDALTGIANRRHFFELAEQELRRARRDGTPLAICMVDVDHFKRLNDRYGHAVGDEVLRQVADGCRSVLRECDVLGRYGGEEFVIALPLTDLATAACVAERLRQRISTLALPQLGPETPLSVTVGVGELAKSETRLDDALLRADRALYAGKAAGRNRVVVAGLPPAGQPPRLAATLWRPELTTLLDGVPATAAAVQAAAVPAAEPPPDRF